MTDTDLAFLQDLIHLQPQGEEAVQAHVAAEFTALGCTVETLRYQPAEVPMRDEFADSDAIATEERAAIIARFAGTGGGRSLIFFAHPDGEPVRGLERWTQPPFEGAIANGRLYGWGVSDDLAGVAIMVDAMRAVAASGQRPRGDVIFASTPSKRHARGVAAVLHHGHLADAAVYLHPAESGVGMREVKAICGGQLYFTIEITGRMPDTTEPGHAAFAHLAANPLDKVPVVQAALLALGEARAARVRHPRIEAAIGRAGNVLVSYARCGEFGRFGRVSPTCTIGGTISFPPGERLADVQAELAAALDAAAASDPWLRDHPPALTWVSGVTGAEVAEDHPLFAVVSAAVSATMGAAPFVNALHTASDIRVPNVQRGIPTVGLGPLGGDLSQNGAVDEWVDVADYRRAVDVAAAVILGWCGPPTPP
ncbi:M20 family metallopeptidase [Plastoroseomonas arctica]|uniref:M20/M25/M40 family metallo-hydrolase n=1 Tax=Plastoroseomonas arctica TaxID=1509237 RepID=A0AAF1KHE5_9PROT|nr:M20/M25/M40 family metallo-hydrolase [Plastoroseomonas arctica]MBR0653864.1 M20/M25/M40 family metallo-hydrolase [Plastoroseomonas arctica]